VQSARLCLQLAPERCYNLPISGVLTANGNPLQFNVQLSDYKTGLPWLQVNPYEDRILQTNFQNVPLTGASTPVNQNDTYLNAQRTLTLNQLPVQAGSVGITANGVFSGQASGTTTAGGGLTLTLPKGIATANALVPGQVQVSAGAVTCTDNGGGGFNAPCNGTVTYATGQVNITAGLPANTTATVNYRFNGQLLCVDNQNGGFTGDCDANSSINYTTGQLTYRFIFNAVNVPQNVVINYSRSVAAGNSVTFNLPPTTSVAPYIYQTAGRVVEVYQGATKLCDRNGGNACTLQVNNNVVTVNFPAGVPQNLILRYSEDVKVDFNPNVDIEQVGRLPNATVPAVMEVRVRLESGETISARAGVNFRVVP
ncbi:MAG: hypothetical protein RMK35_03910, partial [Aquificaceae bacterium]|nr:hypothetical protein [Aquificaceae bacterium]